MCTVCSMEGASKRAVVLRPCLQLRRRLRMVCLRLAVAPEPFCSAMLRRLLYTPRTVKGAGWISIVCESSQDMSADHISPLRDAQEVTGPSFTLFKMSASNILATSQQSLYCNTPGHGHPLYFQLIFQNTKYPAVDIVIN